MLAFFSEPKPAYGLPDLAAPPTSTTYFSFWGRQAREVACSPSFSPKAKLLRVSAAGHLSFPACWLLQKTLRSLSARPRIACLSLWANREEQLDTSPHCLPCTESRMVTFQMERGLRRSPPCQAWFWLSGIRKVLCGNIGAGLRSLSRSTEERGREHHFLTPPDALCSWACISVA